MQMIDVTRKRITIVAPSAGDGGTERVAVELANYLDQKGYAVQYVGAYFDKITYALGNGIVYRTCCVKGKNRISKAYGRCAQINKFVQSFYSDVLISFLTVEHVLAFSNKRLKKIASIRNDPSREFTSAWMQCLRAHILNRADCVVFQTQDEMDYFDNNIRAKGYIIENPIREGLPQWDHNNDSHEVIAVGRLMPQKNWPMMIRAFVKFHKKNQGVHLSIYGQGELFGDLQKLIYELGAKEYIFLRGFTNAVHEKMKSAVIYVSSSNYEGISNAMLEALAIGVPVICTDCPAGGARTYIQDGINGYLVPVGDEDALCEKLNELYRDKKIQDRFSEGSKRIRSDLSMEKIGAKWEMLL